MEAILVSDYADARGGAAKVAIASAAALAARDVAVTFFCATEPQDPALSHPRIRVVSVGIEDVWHQPALQAALNGIANAKVGHAFRQVLAEHDPARTVIHFHQWTKALSPSVLRVAATTAFPALITGHDYLYACPNGTYFDHGTGSPCRLKPLSGACMLSACDTKTYAHKLVRVARQWDLPGLLRRVRQRWGFVHISPLASDIGRSFLPDGARHFILANPIDLAREVPVAVEANDLFLYVGRLLPEKGCLDLAAAGTGQALAFMGEGPLAEPIRQANPAAEILPWGTSAEVGRALARCRALVLPSLWYETFGLVVAEALAKGVPVIVSDRVGAKALVSHGENGLVYPAGDRAALRACLAALGRPGEAARMGAAAHARYWSAPPTVARHADGLLGAYRDMLAAA
jgi:glycosyltransferase involved in cell wall biosynthesis